MSNMRAYSATMFLIFLNLGIITANGMAVYMFYGSGSTYETISNDPTAYLLSYFPSNIGLTDIALALFAFSLLIFFRLFVRAFFSISFIYSYWILDSLNLSGIFTIPITIGIGIIYMIGYTQYMSRQTM